MILSKTQLHDLSSGIAGQASMVNVHGSDGANAVAGQYCFSVAYWSVWELPNPLTVRHARYAEWCVLPGGGGMYLHQHHTTQRFRVSPFNPVWLPLNCSCNPGVNGASCRDSNGSAMVRFPHRRVHHRPHSRSSLLRRGSVSRRFPLIPLRKCLFTAELQCRFQFITEKCRFSVGSYRAMPPATSCRAVWVRERS